MQKNEGRQSKRYAMSAVAALVGLMLAAGGVAAQESYTSDFVGTDADLYEYYDAGFYEGTTADDWFYDYYELDTDLDANGDDLDWTEGEMELDDDIGDEGIWDF